MIGTTNVKDLQQFASRKRKAVVDGFEEEGFFASDCTFDEINQHIRAVQPLGERDQGYNGRFHIPSFDEVIALAKRKSRDEGRVIGIYPETKHSTYHQRLGLALEDRLLKVLDDHGWNRRSAPVFIQSFEQAKSEISARQDHGPLGSARRRQWSSTAPAPTPMTTAS